MAYSKHSLVVSKITLGRQLGLVDCSIWVCIWVWLGTKNKLKQRDFAKSTCANVYGYFSDIDECATNTDNCNENALCTDVEGSFECVCNTGFSGDGVSCASESL